MYRTRLLGKRQPTTMDFRRREMLSALIACLIFFAGGADSRKLDSTELLIGDWDLSVHCDEQWFESELFPPVSSPILELTQTTRRNKRQKKTYPCRLRVFSNGTFHLSPDNDSTDRKNMVDLLPVRGKWNVHQNPYCVTDRFYDELVLKSFSRAKKEITGTEEMYIKKGSVRLQCRMHGHFSAGRLSRRLRNNTGPWYARGRLSRGVLFWEDTEDPKQDKIRASFVGRRFVSFGGST